MANLHRLKRKTGRRFLHFFFIKELFRNKHPGRRDDSVTTDYINIDESEYTYDEDFSPETASFLIVYITCDKSSSGLINSNSYKATLGFISELLDNYKQFKLVSLGRKG